MVNVQSKLFLRCNKSEKIVSQDVERATPYQDKKCTDEYIDKHKTKLFKVKYCEECKEAWEGAMDGFGLQHYPDFPMQRQLEHKDCPTCVSRIHKKKIIAQTESLYREAAHLITNYQEEEAI